MLTLSRNHYCVHTVEGTHVLLFASRPDGVSGEDTLVQQ